MSGRPAALQTGSQASPAQRAVAAPVILWRFGRPHTLIGTTLSVAGLFVIVLAEVPGVELAAGLDNLFWVLVAALCVNVAIVGINQITDVGIDRVNKPFLPIAAGELSMSSARAIVAACTVVPLVLAITQGAAELAAVSLGLLVGAAYSLPPVRLKRFPVLASLSITLVRSLVVNLGVALHFSLALGDPADAGAIPPEVWALTLFVIPFSFAIAILKDVPDLEGDRRYSIRTFTVRMGGERVLRLGMAALTLAYLGMAVLGPLLLPGSQAVVLVAGHLAALALLWRWRAQADPADARGFTRFYMGVWRLFFLEYPLMALAAVAG